MSMEAVRVTTVWSPQPRQSTMLSCPFFEIFYGGARGGGKSDAVLGDFASHADLFAEDAIGLLVRREYKQLRELLERSKQIYTPLGAAWNSQDQMWRFSNGARLTLAHLENDADADIYQGSSYSRIYVEEMGNFPSPTPIFKLMACIRSANSAVHCGFRGTGNPGGVGHQWLKKRYIDPAPKGMRPLEEQFTNPFTGQKVPMTRVFIPAKVTDNKYNNTAQYIARIQMVGNPKLVRAWLNGDWNLIIGAFFDNWDDQKHVIRPIPLRIPWLRFCAADWGSARPFSIGWFCVLGEDVLLPERILPRGSLVQYREWYGAAPEQTNVGLKLTIEQVADGILALESGEPKDEAGRPGIKYRVLDPRCFANEGGATQAERFADKGVHWEPANNQRTARSGKMGGWDLIRQRLDGEDGRPMIYFFSTCRESIRTIPALQHDQLNPEDVDTDSEDHAGDMTRYACASRPWIKGEKIFEPPAMSMADEQGQVVINLDKLFEQSERKARTKARMAPGKIW